MPAVRCSAGEITRHIWEQLEVSVCGVVPVAAVVPVFPYITYWVLIAHTGTSEEPLLLYKTNQGTVTEAKCNTIMRAASCKMDGLDLTSCHFFFFYGRFFSPAQFVGGFTLCDLLVKPWSQVSSIKPPPVLPLPSFSSRQGFSIPAFQLFHVGRFPSKCSRRWVAKYS